MHNEGIEYYFVVIPTKATAYPENLPDFIKCIENDNHEIYKLTKNLKEEGLRVLFLKDVFDQNKKDFPLYQKSDHHWSQCGAAVSATAILKMIRNDLPDIDVFSINDYVLKMSRKKGGDLSNIIGLNNVITESVPDLKPMDGLREVVRREKKGYPCPEGFPYCWGYEIGRTTNDSTLPNLMVVNESYGPYIAPFLSRSFNNSIFIWDNWEYGLNDSIRKQENPDVFITLTSEMGLLKILKNL